MHSFIDDYYAKILHMKEYITPLIDLLNEMTPYLLLGFLIAGILHEFVPRRIYADRLSKNNFSSVLWAALFGVPLPLCSCGVIPTAASLYREGASKGATVSFLISTPQTGVDSILATASVIGLPFAIIRPVVAFVTAIAGGVITNRICRNEQKPAQQTTPQTEKKSITEKIIGTLRYGFVDMIQDIGKWIVIGLVVAAAITVLLPDNFFVTLNKYPLLNMIMILAVSMPMYLCATGSIPIAAALMLKGLSPGAALVLLIPRQSRENPIALGIACACVFLSMYIEKGLTFVIGGLSETPFGEIAPYHATLPEILIIINSNAWEWKKVQSTYNWKEKRWNYRNKWFGNHFHGMNDSKVLNWFADKIKSMVTYEMKDNDGKNWWTKELGRELDYLGYNEKINVSDCKNVYNMLKLV